MNEASILVAARAARNAGLGLAILPSETKNAVLSSVKSALEREADRIFAANAEDLARSQTEGLGAPLVKRLKFDSAKLAEVCAGLDALAAMPDPVGRVLRATELDSGLDLYRVSCPIGVIAMIFESRPDALVQMAGLSLKSGNAVLLKGGREALSTNRALAHVIADASIAAGAPEGWISLLETREEVNDLLELDQFIDLVIPRGSNDFVRHIMKNTLIPVMGHADGICTTYVHADADIESAVRVVVDAKTQYVAVCNSIENLLVHADAARAFLPALKTALDAKNTRIRGCERTRRVIDAEPATEEDWGTEYLDYILAVKIVDSLDEAVTFINRWGSGHTDAILCTGKDAARSFFDRVDSASVLWNCSTRFADGFKYGLGAEVGISTGKLHARGPVGLDGLVTYKWELAGSGQIVADYTGPRARSFTHRDLPANRGPFAGREESNRKQ